MNIDTCPKCGGMLSPSRKICIQCGFSVADLGSGEGPCPYCGKIIDLTLTFCKYCGKRLSQTAHNSSNQGSYGKAKFSQKHYEDLFNKGTILMKKGNLKHALTFFQQALRLNDQDHELFTQLSSVHLNIGNFEEGIKWAGKALELKKGEPLSSCNMAIAQALTAQYDEAVHTLKTCIRLNPDFAKARVMLMQIKRQRDLFGNLKPDPSKVPPDALKLYEEGMKFLHGQNLSRAKEKMEAALNIYGNFLEAVFCRGIIEVMARNFEEAMGYLEKTLELDPTRAIAWTQKGWVFDQRKEYLNAIECYNKAIELDPQYSANWNNKGLALHALEKYEEALECYDRSAELNPDFSGVYINRGMAHKKLGNIERALADFQKCLELNPNNEKAKEEIDFLGILNQPRHETIRTVVDARDYCPRCGKKNYSNSAVCPSCSTPLKRESLKDLMEHALELKFNGLFEEALVKFIRINNLAPANGEAWYYRGKIHCALAEFKNAMMCFSKAYSLDMENFQMNIYALMAKSNLEHFKPPNLSAAHLSGLEVKTQWNFLGGKKWTMYGATHQMFGDYERAFKCYERALEYDENDVAAKKNREFLLKLSKQ